MWVKVLEKLLRIVDTLVNGRWVMVVVKRRKVGVDSNSGGTMISQDDRHGVGGRDVDSTCNGW